MISKIVMVIVPLLLSPTVEHWWYVLQSGPWKVEHIKILTSVTVYICTQDIHITHAHAHTLVLLLSTKAYLLEKYFMHHDSSSTIP